MATTRKKMKAKFNAELSKAKRDTIHKAFKKLARAYKALGFGKLGNFEAGHRGKPFC
jgi:hypothetical protein